VLQRSQMFGDPYVRQYRLTENDQIRQGNSQDRIRVFIVMVRIAPEVNQPLFPFINAVDVCLYTRSCMVDSGVDLS